VAPTNTSPGPRPHQPIQHPLAPTGTITGPQTREYSLGHVRTRVCTPGQNGSRERGFGTMKEERLFREEIDACLADPTIPNIETEETLPTT
jgi:hypothetical protein